VGNTPSNLEFAVGDGIVEVSKRSFRLVGTFQILRRMRRGIERKDKEQEREREGIKKIKRKFSNTKKKARKEESNQTEKINRDNEQDTTKAGGNSTTNRAKKRKRGQTKGFAQSLLWA
jgi:hypothetical protein